jgi:hypothetical protein
MNIFKRLFRANNDNTHSETKSELENKTVKRNPAFEYIQDKYGIDCTIYRKLSSTIYNHAIAAANEFAELIKEKSNENLTHFFFDYFLCFYITTNSEDFQITNKDAYSAIIDGLHFEFYGNASNEVIESIAQLWVTQNRCFLNTDFAAFKNKDKGNRIRLMITIASNCTGKNITGATETLNWVEPFLQIQNSKLSSINTFFQIFKDKYTT